MPKHFTVSKLGIVLEPTDEIFETKGVLNPACYKDGGYVHLFYRALNNKLCSSIGYAKLRGPTEVVERWSEPIIKPEYDYERNGVEDPRIVKIGRTFYLTYVAHDGKNAVTAYATSKNLKRFKKRGVISPTIPYQEALKLFEQSSQQRLKDAYYFFSAYYKESAGWDVLVWHKDFILFPKKIKRKFYALQRVLPDIQVVPFRSFKDLKLPFWEHYFRNLSKYVILENKHWYESRNIGGGCPPIETDRGWLVIFHAVEETNRGRVYRASAALLDRDDPLKVIGKLHEPLFSPTESWERGGGVANVVFPTGTVLFEDDLYIYYGAADSRIGVAKVKLSGLLDELLDPTLGHTNE